MSDQHEDLANRLCIVEDDAELRELILTELGRDHVDVSAVGSIAELRALMRVRAFDLLVLDLCLPDGDGVQLCRELRSQHSQCAIIMVTARGAPCDRILGLEEGADDYLTKPFEPRELRARIRNLLRRRRLAHESRRSWVAATFGRWRLDLRQRRLLLDDGRMVMLSAAEFRLLNRFLHSPDQVLSREQLLPERSRTVAVDRSIDIQISRLRQKLAAGACGGEIIVTVRNEGYIFAGPIEFE